ncbi:MAG TPA: NADH-quinone oxidoreductase subunit N [Dehalococcoidia bacterium]|nr:NADH-quinone oxidoreductase subunit N [Dehalococcoidia bacterium]
MNYYLITPEIIVAGLAVAVILLDLIVRNKGILAALSIVGLLGSLAVSIALWGRTDNELFGGMLRIDQLALSFNVLLCGVAILVILASQDYVSKFARFQGEFYALLLLSVIGMMLMAASRDLITIYVSLEATSISLYALTAFLKDKKSSEAGLKYLLLGAIASGILLFGMALTFGVTGETNIGDITTALAASGMGYADNPAILLGLIFLIGGFGFKIATVPMQMWVPDVYEGAPTPITAYLSVASKAVGFAVILRVFFGAFGGDQFSDYWAMIFAVLSAISMLVGNIVAIQQTNIKRMLGYSSIAQAGYLMVGLAAVTKDPGADFAMYGPTGIVFFMAAYALANLGVFFAVIAITNKINSDKIEGFSGMGHRAPLLSLALTLCLISLTGLPPAAGFLAKFYLFNSAVHQGLAWLVVLGVFNSAISAYYYFRVVKVTWFGAPKSEDSVPSSWALRIALLITCLGVLVLFFYPSGLLYVAQTVAGVLSP